MPKSFKWTAHPSILKLSKSRELLYICWDLYNSIHALPRHFTLWIDISDYHQGSSNDNLHHKLLLYYSWQSPVNLSRDKKMVSQYSLWKQSNHGRLLISSLVISTFLRRKFILCSGETFGDVLHAMSFTIQRCSSLVTITFRRQIVSTEEKNGAWMSKQLRIIWLAYYKNHW